jgi:hypothetical protein
MKMGTTMRRAISVTGALGILGVVGFAGSAASADVLVSQPSDRPSQQSFFSDSFPGQFFSQRMADNFTLTSDAEVTGIRWWGGSQNFSSPDVDNMVSWTVTLFGLDGFGGPDIATAIDLGTFTFAETNAVATGATLFGGGIEYMHEISFAVSISTPVSTGSASARPSGSPAGDAWVWSGSTAGDLVNATDFFTGSGFTVFDPTANDLAFEVIGVPAPASVGLLAFAGVFCRAPSLSLQVGAGSELSHPSSGITIRVMYSKSFSLRSSSSMR